MAIVMLDLAVYVYEIFTVDICMTLTMSFTIDQGGMQIYSRTFEGQ